MTDQQYLEIYIDIVHKKNKNKVYGDYKELAEIINTFFGVNYTAMDILNYYEELDVKLMYKNCVE